MSIHETNVIRDPEAQWLRLRLRVPPAHREALEAAFHLAARVHCGQKRKARADSEGAPYILHPLRVARIALEEWDHCEPELLAVCLLHDVIEDCPALLRDIIEREIERVEGRDVLDAVIALTKPRLPSPVPPDVKAARDARYFRVLFNSPVWIRMVKCADRVDNLRDARAWGDLGFWERYSSETIGWHLYLARETAPITEVALFKALVDGERELRGRVPVWADGRIIDPLAARLVPEEIARGCGVIGLARRGETLLLGVQNSREADAALLALRTALQTVPNAPTKIESLPLSDDALQDALASGLYGESEAPRD